MPDYRALAEQTRRFTLRRFSSMGGARDPARAPFVTFVRSEVEPQWTDLWYVATQIGADAELLELGSGERLVLDRTTEFIDRFWYPSGGGYLARGSADGREFYPPDRYCDDHGHLGLMLLLAWRATGEAAQLGRARRAADYLISGGLWDENFGGGFWWNTRHGDSPEGKPAQSNGLAAHLFLELYLAVGERRYLDWALRTLNWLDSRLFDSSVGLYRWSVHYANLQSRRGEVVAQRLFNYDQGIIIEALLALHRVEADPALVERAQRIAARLEPTFWHTPEGGFNLEAGVEQVMPVYSSWLTCSLVALHRIDGDDRWLDLARRNVDAMNGYLRSSDGGYFEGAAQDAEMGRWSVRPVFDQVACSGMQRALVALTSV